MFPAILVNRLELLRHRRLKEFFSSFFQLISKISNSLSIYKSLPKNALLLEFFFSQSN